MAKGEGNVIAQNKKARHDYTIVDTVEAGIVLTGTEIKSIRAGRINLKDGFAQIKNSDGEIWPRVPFLEELNSFRGQKRELLRLADISGALDLASYIKAGGFKGMAQALLSF